MPRDPASDHTNITAAEIVSAEAAALAALARRLETDLHQPFTSVLDLLERATAAGRPLFLTGIGKSGLIAQKIAATFRSTGTPAHFLHPTEALHGDLGMLASGDTVLLLSASGETAELLALLPSAQRLNLTLIALCCAPASTLARASTLALDLSISEEACPHNLAPTTSTTVMLALGDALALTLSQHRGFAPEHFADLHPGGHLGLKLTRVRDVMHTGDAIPSVSPTTLMPDVIYEMSRKKLGLTTVLADDGSVPPAASPVARHHLRRRPPPHARARRSRLSLALRGRHHESHPHHHPRRHLRRRRPRPYGSPRHHSPHRHQSRQPGRRDPPSPRPLEAQPPLTQPAAISTGGAKRRSGEIPSFANPHPPTRPEKGATAIRIATWNVNSVRARLPLVLSWLETHQPDVLLLQELKGTDFPADVFESVGYQSAAVTQKSYNGVAILSPHPIETITTTLAGDEKDSHARFLEAIIEGIRIVNIYLPNGNPIGTDKFTYKLAWMDRLQLPRCPAG